jgi:hypothetical protein
MFISLSQLQNLSKKLFIEFIDKLLLINSINSINEFDIYLHLQDVGNRVTLKPHLMTSCHTFYALTRRLGNDGDFDLVMNWNN